ncbi:hypothetical protein MTO98_04620 [Mucilaginibacter sp. SMC90]|uniref:hypothetical protein n=1 Tax=Mucilaginibacter sp. SMC90 TaxID=2929803 RepID=UPI001FB3AE00|nr:hypothetical protein [Mucilaginibacter sp. SMC90]UOE50355.1 hypothetical protein MTO98_04620 [Mucilaginibacter sp. SMC90]
MNLSVIIRNIFLCVVVLVFGLPAYAQNGNPAMRLNRDVLIKKLTEADSGLVFKRDTDISLLPNFVAVDANGSQAQLIGKPDELMIVKWTYVFRADEKTNLIELQKLAWFANTLGDQEGLDWFFAQLAELGKDYKKPISEIKMFDSKRKGEISYSPKEKTLTMTFTPW